MFELTTQEIDQVSGAISADTYYATAVGAAVALVAVAIAPVSVVVGLTAAVASIALSATAVAVHDTED